MAGAAVGSFITGLFDGVRIKHGWEDRKREQAFDDEDYAFKRVQRDWAKEDRGFAAEDRDWTRKEREWTRQDRERAMEQRRIMDEANAKAADAIKAGAAGGQETGSNIEYAPMQPQGPMPLPSAQAGTPSPFAAPGYVVPPSAPLAYDTSLGGSGDIPGQIYRPTAQPDPTVQALDYEIGQIESAQAAGTAPGWTGPALSELQAEREARVAENNVKNAAAGVGQRPALAYGDIGAAPKQDETYPVAEGSGGQSKDTGFEAMVSPVASPVPGAASVDPQTGQLQLPRGNPASPASGDPGAALAVREIAFPEARGPAKGKKKDPIDAFESAYLEAIPTLVEGYVRIGEHEKAAAFMTFAESAQGKKAVRQYGKLIQATMMNDPERVLTEFADYINMYGAGTTILRHKSKIITDDAGNMIGVDVALRNDETGAETVQRVDGNTLQDMQVLALPPEVMFENSMKQQQADAEARRNMLEGAIQHERNIELAQIRGGGSSIDRESAMKMLSDNIPGFFSLPIEQREAMIAEIMQAGGGGYAAAPPALRQ